jgi:predicted negative regulator of RcsB-dependent stress response
MKKVLEWVKGFLSENGEASSKRFVGVISGIALCYTLYANHNTENEPSEALVYSVAALSAAALGISAAEKIFKKTNDKE